MEWRIPSRSFISRTLARLKQLLNCAYLCGVCSFLRGQPEARAYVRKVDPGLLDFDHTLLCRPPEREEEGRHVTMPCKPNVSCSGERCSGSV